jgi:8-hydroxy-5-deazaflavin:NADPH oxidoreductase
MRVAVLGTGEVGKSLGNAFLALGHEVRMGARDASNEKAVAWAANAEGQASAGTFADAAGFGEIVVLATLGSAVQQVLQAAVAQACAGKLVIDTTNPLDFSQGSPRLAIGHTDSGGEQVQRLLPAANVVKAFNTVGNALMFRPSLPGGPPDMFICGNDEASKERVTALLLDFGWRTIDLGTIESSRYLEPMCMVWVVFGLRSKGWNHAFKLLRK